jgi:hypothetical protein
VDRFHGGELENDEAPPVVMAFEGFNRCAAPHHGLPAKFRNEGTNRLDVLLILRSVGDLALDDRIKQPWSRSPRV